MEPGRPQPNHSPSPFAFAAPSSSNPAHSSAPPTTAPAAFSTFAERGRGRGRGAFRGGTGRGAGGAGAQGFARHQNLSWRKPADPPAEATGAPALSNGDAPEQSAMSAFTAFGAAAPAGGAFGSAGGAGGGASAFGSFGGTGTSAFGAPSVGAFGAGGNAFGGSGFGASTSTSLPSTSAPSSAFASTSAFSSAAPASSTPLFRAPSRQGEEEQAEGDEEEEEEEDDDDNDEADESPSEPASKRSAGQISTLEVLGEDSDARKKRFEATLPNNRYLELKPLREAQRLKAIKSGLIPDPSKPMRLDQATDFEGTCEDMCPEWEREEREYQNNVDPLERYPGTTRIDPARAVKAFHRPAAGNDQPLPSDVRPPPVLHSTLDYLFHTLLPTLPLATTHPFIRDRTRSIRQDFTVQNVRGRSAIECNERIARYHILAVGTLREQSGFSESQELEQLRKVLKSLNEFYDDARTSGTAVPSPNEAEFRAYNLLTHLRDPDIVWSTELLPRALFAHPLLQRALALHRLAQRASLPRGERAAPGAFSRFFKLVADDGTPYLFACILSTHFAEVRRGAVEALRGAFLRQHSAFPLATLAKMLGCDDEDEARSVCEQLGLVVRADENGAAVAEIHKQAVLKTTTLKPHVSIRLVEAKRGSKSYQDVIDGGASGPAAVAALPAAPAPTAPPEHSASAPSARSAPTLSASAPAFSFAPQPAAASPIPSPFDSPALGATLATSAPQNGLNAAAPTFVPSFSLTAPAVSVTATAAPASAAPPAPAFPPSISATPLTTTAPAFSFAPAPASSAAPAAAPSAAPEPAPPARPTKRLPPSLLRTAVSAAPFVPAASPVFSAPSAPPPVASRASLSPTLRRSPTARRTSLAHAPHQSHNPHAAEAPFPSAASAAAVAARTQRVEALAGGICAELLGGLARAAAGRAAATALKERWAAVREAEKREKERLVEVAARRAEDELGRLAVREAVLRGVRDEEKRGETWERWKRALDARRRWKAQQREKKRVLDEVVRGIERERDDERAEADEDDVVSDEDMDDDDLDLGLAGLADAGLDFGGLSLGAPAAPSSSAKVDLASRVRKAAATRDRIWQRGTFLNSVSALASTALARVPRPLPTRPTWTALVAVEAAEAPFAAWLACKFDLDPRTATAEIDAPSADVEVRMLGKKDELATPELESTGLLVFDCTATKSEPVDWSSLRGRLHSLVSRVSERSLFRPAVLAVLCPDRTLSPDEASSLRDEAAQELQLSALESEGGKTAVWIARFDGAEGEFDAELRGLLDVAQVREERILRPMSTYLDPLLKAWQRSFARAYKLQQDQATAPSLASAYLEPLQAVVYEAEAVASPTPRSRLKVPPLEVIDSSFRQTVERYIALPIFRPAGHFPDLTVALAQRPPLSDLAVSRLTLEHVAEFASSALAPLKVQSGALTAELLSAFEQLDAALAAAEVKLRPRSPAPTPPATPQRGSGGSGAAGKKRRASAAPMDAASSPKKLSGAARDERTDRLGALEGLLKDARALLAQ